jgi:hypothetical protein
VTVAPDDTLASIKRNPVCFRVTAGRDVLLNVEMPADSIASQTFRITTSLSQPST